RARIARIEYALDDQRTLPQAPYQRKVRPVEPSAFRPFADHTRRQNRRASRREVVLEMRHPVTKQRAHKGAEQPPWTHEAIPGKAKRRAKWRGEAGPQIVLAIRRNLRIDGHHQRAESGERDTLDQRRDLSHVARKIGLEPG